MQITRSQREEDWNAISHGLGFLAALAAFPFLIYVSVSRGDSFSVVSSAIFGTTMLLTLGASTIYHASRSPQNRRTLQIVDHMSIYLLIAGSYTPLCLTALRGPWGWSLFGVVWGMAITGVLLKTRFTGRFEALSTAMYLAMGWLCLIAIVPMFQLMQVGSLVYLLIAGIAFSTGVAFYLQDHRRGFHFAWHLFVMAGCVGLYGAVFTEIART